MTAGRPPLDDAASAELAARRDHWANLRREGCDPDIPGRTLAAADAVDLPIDVVSDLDP